MVGETTVSYLERVAEANHLSTTRLNPHLIAALGPSEEPRTATGFPSGWQQGAIEQACPRCLHETGAWLREWRDPMMTCCTRHGLLLIDTCPGCSRPLRDVRHSPLRPTGYTTTCGNALGPGLSSRCDTNLANLRAEEAPAELLAQQAHYEAHSNDPTVLASDQEPDRYRETLLAVAVLLLHLTGITRTPHRWSLRRPDPATRADVVLRAHRVLTAPTADAAIEAFQEWFDQIPPSNEGPTAWALDHTISSPAMTRLVMAAASTRQRLSHRLKRCTDLPAPDLPQVLPRHLAHLVDGLGLSPATARAFAPLCLAKAQLGRTGTWSTAARTLGLTEAHGPALACTAFSHLTCSVDTWVDALGHVSTQLDDEAVDYGARAAAVTELRSNPRPLIDALRIVRPGTRDNSAGYAWTWVAEEWAAMAPRRSKGDRQERALYLQFRASLARTHELTLTSRVEARNAET